MKKLILSFLTLTTLAFVANAGTTGGSNLVIAEQSDTTIFCDEATPIYVSLLNYNGPITVTWKFNGVEDTTYTQPQGDLYVGYQPTQEGVYTCEIFDDFGGSVVSAPIVTIRSNIYDLFILENNDVLSLSETPDSIPYMQTVINWYIDGESFASGATATVQGPGSYTATVYYAYKASLCPAITEPFIATGIENNAVANSISLFPNPATNMVTISTPHSIANISVYDVAGKLVMGQNNTQANNISLDIATLSNGFYTVQMLTAKGEMVTKKLIKQ
ncbi:MAG: T9SS type A sorting domain-containing protein [Sphingobacteriales bacterium JAD_PAG50586_3]|nr:MAG: T9SS type A sorting domain-containing protein [Sphingobacteriales bacterium JAD_PAG50586_3]